MSSCGLCSVTADVDKILKIRILYVVRWLKDTHTLYTYIYIYILYMVVSTIKLTFRNCTYKSTDEFSQPFIIVLRIGSTAVLRAYYKCVYFFRINSVCLSLASGFVALRTTQVLKSFTSS